MLNLALTIVVLCAVGLMTLFVLFLLQVNFLPSAGWAGGTGGPVFLASLILGGAATLIFLREGATTRGFLKTHKLRDALLYGLGVPIFIACGLSFFVFNTLPAAHALVVRDTVTHVHVVDRVQTVGGRYCRDALGLTLKQLPLMHRSICGIPPGLFEQLDAGDRIAVTGLGSSLGVFVFRESIRVLDP